MNDDSRVASFDAASSGFLCGFLHVSGCSGEADRPVLERLRATIGQEVRERWGGKGKSAFREDSVLEAYRRFYGRFGNSYFVQLQLETAAKGEKPIPLDIPLVSVMFLGELRHRILTATHDALSVRLPVSIGEADGTHVIRRMGGAERALKPGDLFMADGDGVISSVLAGPDERTRVTERTTDAIYTTYVPPGIGDHVLAAYLDDLEGMIASIYPASRIDGRWTLGTQNGEANA